MSSKHEHLRGQHEPETAAIGRIIMIAGALVILVIIAMAGVRFQLQFYRWSQPRRDAQNPNPNELPTIPARVDSWAHPGMELVEMRSHEDQLLKEYRWIDQSHGVVAIPIGRAMDLVAAEPESKEGRQ